jgi:large exoprotein involved in heme utilization and adhesion
LQFGQQAQPIQVQTLADQLEIKPQNTLALLGGDITIIGSPLPTPFSSHLTVPAGRIELGSVEAGSFVNLTPVFTGWQLGYEKVNLFRDIHISNSATLSISDFENLTDDGGGTVQVRGHNVNLISGSAIISFTIGNQPSGNISVNASETLLIQGSQEENSSGLFSQTFNNGNAGDIETNSKYLILEDGGNIFSRAFENPINTLDFAVTGNSGNININASESVEITGSNLESGNSSIAVGTRTLGNAGSINIVTKQLTLRDGADITASSAPPPEPREQGLINEGQGGEINITATESITIQGTGQLLERTTILDNKGNILEVRETITTIPSRIIAETQGAGDGGNIKLTTGQVNLSDQGQITASSLGEIRADNPQNLQLGNAGNININADAIFINNQGLISAESNSGQGGNINLRASDLILLRNNSNNFPDENPYISTRAGLDDLSAGNGGNITIDTPFLVAVPTENTDIVANAFTGDGGNIDITTFGIFGLEVRDNFTPLSEINASSEFGTSGVIIISRPDVNPEDNFVKLPTNIVDPETLIVQQCGVTGEYAKGEFIITGKSGLPVNPLESIEIIQGIVDLRTPEISQSQQELPTSVTLTPIPKPIVEAQGWRKDEQGNIVLVASQGTTPRLNEIPCTILQD